MDSSKPPLFNVRSKEGFNEFEKKLKRPFRQHQFYAFHLGFAPFNLIESFLLKAEGFGPGRTDNVTYREAALSLRMLSQECTHVWSGFLDIIIGFNYVTVG